MANRAFVVILACISALAARSEKVSVEFGECSSAPHAEIAAALLQNAQSKRMAPLEKIFDSLDVNNDSMLDPSEFKPWYEAQSGATAPPAADATTLAAAMAATTTMATGAPTTGMDAGTEAAAATTAMAAGTTPMPAATKAAAATTGQAAGTTGMAAGTTAPPAPQPTGMAKITTEMADMDIITTGMAATTGAADTPIAATTAMPMKEQGTKAPQAPPATTAAPATTIAPMTSAAPPSRSLSEVLKTVASVKLNASGPTVYTKGKGMTLDEPTGELLQDGGHLRYMRVFPNTDMIVTTVDSYITKSPNKNGATKGMGVINIMGGTSTTFKFNFVHSGTDSPVVIDELYFSLIDMSRTGKLVKEATLVSGFEHVYLDMASTVEWQQRNGSRPSVFRGSIEAPQYAAVVDTDRRKSVAFRSLSVSEFQIKLGSSAGDQGVNFYFGGRSTVVTGKCMERTPVKNAYFSQVGYSNLGGMGPTFASPKGMTFKHVLEVEDEDSPLGYIPVDLQVKNIEGRYHPGMADRNGCAGGGIGSINFEGGTVATFSFTLVDNALKAVPQKDFVLTFMDIDKSPRGGTTDSFTLHGFQHAYLSEDSAFTVTEVEKGFKKFTGTFNDDPYARRMQPATAFDLTAEQQSRSFAVEFSTAGMVTLKADFSQLPEGYSRTLYFAGHSRLTAGREMLFFCDGK